MERNPIPAPADDTIGQDVLESRERLLTLARLLSQRFFSYQDEKRCQEEISDFLDSHGVPHEREFPLAGGPVDFYFPRSGLVMEVKAGKLWSRMQVFRQIERYCSDARVKGLLLATGRSQGLPDRVKGKPTAVYLLGEAAL